MKSHPITDHERLQTLIVQCRFPGYTLDVMTAFWDTISKDKIDPNDALFAVLFRRRFPSDVDFTDNALPMPSDSSANQLVTWADRVYAHHDHLEKASSQNDIDWFRGEIAPNSVAPSQHSEIEKLNDRIRNLEDEVANLESSDIDPSKRTGTLYRIILGLAERKFNYVAEVRGSASTNISKCLPHDCAVTGETVREVLEEAVRRLR